MTDQQVDTSKDSDHSKEKSKEAETGGLTLFQVIGSSLAAAFGVQSKENKIRDFERGKPHQFIIAGILFTLLFLVGMIALVNLIV